MDLTSCSQCGVVIDKDVLIFPATHDHDSGNVIAENAEWDEGEQRWLAKVDCPVCGGAVLDK